MSKVVPRASALNITAGLYLHDDGLTYPVMNWLDRDGDECAPGDAVVCVAGKEGRWFSLVIEDFDGRTQ